MSNTANSILSIPPEIIAEILVLLLSSDLPLSVPPPAIDPLWSASQTCSLWRQVALAFPRLWNCLCIRFPQSKDYCALENTIQAARECLQRSYPAPLSITLALQVHLEEQDKPARVHAGYPLACPLFLAPHAQRIKSFSLATPTDLSPCALSFTLPNLQHLNVDVPDVQRRMHLTELINHSGRALTHLNICYPFTGIDWCGVLVHTKHLVSLWTPNPLPYDVIHTISIHELCPNLQALRCGLYEEASDAFLDMLERRECILRCVMVECMKFELGEVKWEKVNALRRGGMDVTILEPPLWCS